MVGALNATRHGAEMATCEDGVEAMSVQLDSVCSTQYFPNLFAQEPVLFSYKTYYNRKNFFKYILIFPFYLNWWYKSISYFAIFF